MAILLLLYKPTTNCLLFFYGEAHIKILHEWESNQFNIDQSQIHNAVIKKMFEIVFR